MGTINVVGVDQEEMLDLWECARREYDAANALLLTGDRGQDRSVALHLCRGWHALASMFARKSGLPGPGLDSFTLDHESILLAPISARRLSDWASSFASVREAALRVPWHTNFPELDERVLRRQAGVLGKCVKAHRPHVARVPFGSQARKIGWRNVLIALAVLVLTVGAYDLGKRVWVSLERSADAGATSLTIPQEVFLSLEELGEPKPGGYAWDGPGTVRFMNRAVISLGDIAHPEVLILSLDGNDAYLLSLMSGDGRVGFVKVEPSWNAGLDVYTVTVPEEAVSLGFDSIIIESAQGDGAYALGHLLLGPIDDGQPTAAEGPG